MLSLIVDKGVEVTTVLNMLMNLSLYFFPLAAPISAFFATIFVLSKLSEDSEIIAMRSFGINKFQLYMPFLILSLSIGFALNSLSSILIPRANADFKNTVVKLTSSGMLTSIKSGQFFTDIPNATLFAQSVSEDGNGFKNVFLHVNEKKTSEQRIIFAKSGTLIKIYADDWHAPSLRLHLKDGNIIHVNKGMDRVEKVLFEEYDFPIFNTDFATQMLAKDSMKTNQELDELIAKKEREYQTAIQQKKSSDEILNLKKSLFKTQNEYYSRLILFWQIVLFVFVGFTLGIKKGRGKGKNNTATAALMLIGYFVIYFLLLSISQKGSLSPLLASNLPSLFLLFFGIKFFKDLDWAT